MLGAKSISFALLLIASHFVAGIRGKDEDEDIPKTNEEVRAFLKECEDFGKLAASAAASAACGVVLNRCPPAALPGAPVVEAKISRGRFAQSIIEDRLKETLERACETKLFETCGNNAFLQLEMDPDLRSCFDILVQGPGSDLAPSCPSKFAANCLFETHVSSICGQTAEPEEAICMKEKKEEKKEEEEKEKEKEKGKAEDEEEDESEAGK